jgi:hypothetical protein
VSHQKPGRYGGLKAQEAEEGGRRQEQTAGAEDKIFHFSFISFHLAFRIAGRSPMKNDH